MILVFDLDDTLYEEKSYVISGFKAVATYISEKYNLNFESSLQIMLLELDKNGRGRVFDELLIQNAIYSKKEVKKCLSVYRMHLPQIQLTPEAVACIDRFKNLPLYIVTDGNKIVQHKKIIALGVHKLVKKYFITYRFGLKHSKPSPYCFQKIAEMEKVNPEKIVYIGDNVNKDFVGIKPLGFKTIRVKTGHFADLMKDSEYEAEFSINNLNELTHQFLNTHYGN